MQFTVDLKVFDAELGYGTGFAQNGPSKKFLLHLQASTANPAKLETLRGCWIKLGRF